MVRTATEASLRALRELHVTAYAWLEAWPLDKTLQFALAAADITATTAYSEPLPMAQADSPYDVLVVANLNAFPKNIDGSLRLADPASGVEISTCYLNDHSDKAFVWPTALNDRKRRKALEPLLDVPTAYAAQGVPQLSEEVQTSLRRALKPLVKARNSSCRNRGSSG